MDKLAWLQFLRGIGIAPTSGTGAAEPLAQAQARANVDKSAANLRQFNESRGVQRDAALAARKEQYLADLRQAPTVPYTDTTPGATPTNNRSAALPKPVLERIVTTAKAQGVDPYTALAIALMETNGGTVQPASPVNPMQENSARTHSEFDAIPQAVGHLRELMEKYPGNEAKAIQGYNGFGVSPAAAPGKLPYNKKVLQFRDDLMRQSAIVDALNNAGKR